MRKTVLFMLLTGILLLSLSACSPAKQETGTETASATVTEPETETEAKTEARTENPIGAPYNKPEKPLTGAAVLNAFKSYAFQDESTGKVIPFRIYLPDGYTEGGAYPVLLFLHGAGQRGNDNKQQVEYAVANFFSDVNSPVYGSIVVCPQCPTDEQWVNTPWENGSYKLNEVPMSESLHAVLELVYFVRESYSVDPARIYVTGLSMGGFGTWDLCMRAPDLFAAAVPMCGGGSPDDANLLARLPIVTVHGDADNKVPVSGTREMVAALKAIGNGVTYYEMQGYTHNVWDWTMTNLGILTWLYSQSYPDAK